FRVTWVFQPRTREGYGLESESGLIPVPLGLSTDDGCKYVLPQAYLPVVRNFFVKALNTAPHMVYMIPLATFCTGCALKRHYDRRVDGVERTFNQTCGGC
ncbi:hypothetical protein AHF37_02033, partial [Paragonimus kellicotti]